MARLDEYLNDDEYNTLEEVGENGRNLAIPRQVRDRLLQLGYIQETVNGLRITSAGQMRLALGK